MSHSSSQSVSSRTYRHMGPDGRISMRTETTTTTLKDGKRVTETKVTDSFADGSSAAAGDRAGASQDRAGLRSSPGALSSSSSGLGGSLGPASGVGGASRFSGGATPAAAPPAAARSAAAATPAAPAAARVPAAAAPGAAAAAARAGVHAATDPVSQPPSKEYRSGWGQRGPHVRPGIAIQATNYEELRKQCLAQGALWEDPEFLAVNESIFYSQRPPRAFEWKRPSEICENPQVFVGGASRFDIQQGELGDCWLLAAVASLTCNNDMLHKVVPDDQSFDKDYCGIFRLRFWQYGQWVDVIIDDRLPTYNGKLVFLHSADNNEFWSALLEKAYAKLCGSYEALKGGSQAEAMEDFTGGLTERFDISKVDQNQLLKIMLKADERGSLMGCAIDAQGRANESRLPTGLLTGHAYSITAVKMVDIKTARTAGKMPLVRIRNPWGNEVEWKGAWSDKSAEWNLISESERNAIGLTFSDDGEFWMSFRDFATNFTTLELCSLGPEQMSEQAEGVHAKCRWEATVEQGQWIRRVNAGGCRNFIDTFWTNPQYRINVTDPDDGDDNDLCTVIIGLMQKDRRKLRKAGVDLLTMGYAIYQLKDQKAMASTQLDLNFFRYNASFAKSPSFINTREVCGRHQLPPGSYIIVPSTFEPNEEASFLLRLFTEKPNDASCIDEATGFSGPPKHIALPAVQADVLDKLKEQFAQIAGDDMEVDAYELQGILNSAYSKEYGEFKFDGFSLETSRSMVAMHDRDHSGKLGFEEFKQLWTDLQLWKAAFKKFDADNSGTFNSYELRNALRDTGFNISNATFNCLVMRFASKDGAIRFDDFILCAVRLKSLYETHKDNSKGSHAASFTLDQFVQLGIYS